jgi:hypothetical protein
MRTFQFHPKVEGNWQFWDRKLSEPPQWLLAARISPGKRGISALWSPPLIAHALLDRGHMTPKALDRVMREQFPQHYEQWVDDTPEIDRG